MAKSDYTPSMTMIQLDFIAKEVHHLVQNDSRGEGVVASLVKVATDVAIAGIEITDFNKAADSFVPEIAHLYKGNAVTEKNFGTDFPEDSTSCLYSS